VRGDLERGGDQTQADQARTMLGLSHQREPEVGDDQAGVLDRGVGDEEPKLTLEDTTQDSDQSGQRANQQRQHGPPNGRVAEEAEPHAEHRVEGNVERHRGHEA